MLEINYNIENSKDKGKGIFTLQTISMYSLIWDFNKADVYIYNEYNAIKLISKLIKDNDIHTLLIYSYFKDNLLVDIRNDDGRFFNHSNNPNVVLGYILINNNIPGNFDPNSTYALRDIEIGEELVDNYNTYGNEPEWYKNILEEYKIDISYL